MRKTCPVLGKMVATSTPSWYVPFPFVATAHSEHRITANNYLLQGYAVFCGALSAITCIVYFIPPIVEIAGIIALGWNTLMFVFWIALFGTFGSVCIP